MYNYYSLYIVICLSFHVHNRVKNIFKHVLFNVHDIKIMTKEISLPIRKLSKNTLLYPIMVHTKTMKLMFTGLKTHNAIVQRHHII